VSDARLRVNCAVRHDDHDGSANHRHIGRGPAGLRQTDPAVRRSSSSTRCRRPPVRSATRIQYGIDSRGFGAWRRTRSELDDDASGCWRATTSHFRYCISPRLAAEGDREVIDAAQADAFTAYWDAKRARGVSDCWPPLRALRSRTFLRAHPHRAGALGGRADHGSGDGQMLFRDAFPAFDLNAPTAG